MKLNLVERLSALSILPGQGNIVTLKIVGDLRQALSPTEAEFKTFEIVQKDANITWNTDKGSTEVEIPIGEKATDIIVDALKKLNEEQKLIEQHMSLYEKFIDDK